jgi:hypothetical protein
LANRRSALAQGFHLGSMVPAPRTRTTECRPTHPSRSRFSVPICAAPDSPVGFSGGLELRGSNDPAASQPRPASCAVVRCSRRAPP